MESKVFFTLAIILGCAFQAYAAPSEVKVENTVAESKMRDARQALNQANQQLQNNLISALSRIANTSVTAGTNVSRAANTLIRGLVTNTVSLAGVVAYMPRLAFLDGPSQFTETLRLIRTNQVRLPTDMNSAIDTLIVFANQQRDSGIGENFSPAFTFLPNLFNGFGDFFTTLIDSLFAVTNGVE